MFGLDRIRKYTERNVERIDKVLLEIWKKIQSLEDNEEVEEPRLTERKGRTFWGEGVVNCDKCKCLLYQRDAIKGESRIVNRVCGDMNWHNDGHELRIDISNGEEIQEVFLCHKCGGKNDNQRKSNKRSKKSS